MFTLSPGARIHRKPTEQKQVLYGLPPADIRLCQHSCNCRLHTRTVISAIREPGWVTATPAPCNLGWMSVCTSGSLNKSLHACATQQPPALPPERVSSHRAPLPMRNTSTPQARHVSARRAVPPSFRKEGSHTYKVRTQNCKTAIMIPLSLRRKINKLARNVAKYF